MPTDELQSAEESLAVLQHVLHTIAKDDLNKQTPCREFDVEKLTDHLMNSITTIGGMAGAEFPERDRPALDAWHHRGLDGTVPFGKGEAPAKMMVGVLSIEFLVHAWDYGTAIGREVTAPEALSDYVMGLARKIITPQGRTNVGFDDPVEVPADAGALDQLIAYTGRKPSG
jgi:uncharacterized protein (TIGR03083 family)